MIYNIESNLFTLEDNKKEIMTWYLMALELCHYSRAGEIIKAMRKELVLDQIILIKKREGGK